MHLQYFGHNSFRIEYGGKSFILDPFITPNEQSKGKVNVDDQRCDFILLTHAHQDHIFDVEAIQKNNPEAVVVSNWEIYTHYTNKGMKGHPLNHGGAWTFDNDIWIKYVQAVHTSSFPDGSYGGQPGGFVLKHKDEPTLYIAGDTALTLDMKLIPLTCGEISVAILPIGGNFTMDYNDAAIAAEFVLCDHIVGCHYDTFGWIKIDQSKAKAAFEAKGKTLYLPEIGGSLSFSPIS